MGQGGDQILSHGCSLGSRLDLLQHHREFIATQTDHWIVGADRGTQTKGNRLQHKVASAMTLGIVDILEVVQANDQQRSDSAADLRPRQRIRQKC